MPTYISLVNWTDQGIRNIKDSPGRLDAVKELDRKHGAEVTHFFMTMGSYDMVVITEAPDDETAAKLLLTLGQSGNVRTTMLKAFTEAEYRQIVGSLN